MKCYYEVLGVARDANDSDIKTAYRKLALRWHPDKNLHNPDEATQQFQLVQQAYEVLSDPHERAWYDNHREQIIRGKNSDYEDDCLDVFQYFTVTCFKGYGDDENGFYQVYANVFAKIAAEDGEFMDKEEFQQIPKFGNSTSNYEEVVAPFYAYWQSYSTKKSYSWLCPYNISEIRDRRALREIEKEMKKVVQKAKRERNEEVRALASFVRKRDKRVQAYRKMLEEKAELNRQKQKQNRLDQIKRRQEEIKAARQQNSHSNNDYEEQLRMLELEYKDSDESDLSEYDDEDHDYENTDDDDNDSLSDTNSNLQLDDENLNCIACNKRFESENALRNHTNSKEHRKNIEKLKKTMQEEEETYINTTKSESQFHNEIIDEHVESDEIEQVENENKSKSKKKKKSKQININAEDSEEEIVNIHLSDKEDDDWDDNKKSNKKSKGKKVKSQQKTTTPIAKTVPNDNKVLSASEEKESGRKSSKSNGTSLTSEKKQCDKKAISCNQIDLDHVCVTCKASFESKNKLFKHLQETKHGVYIPKPVVKNSKSKVSETKKGKNHK